MAAPRADGRACDFSSLTQIDIRFVLI